MNTQKGNVLIYVLIAVALLAALTYTIMGENRGQQQNQLSDAQIKLLATDLIKHAVAAEMAVQQMTQWGIDYDQILFDLPGTAGYSTNTTRQMYHPSGGGLQVFGENNDMLFDSNWTSRRGFTFQNQSNIVGSPTTATDLIMSFIDVNESVCREINKQVINEDTVIDYGVNYDNVFDPAVLPNAAFNCANCNGAKAGCIYNTFTYAFYYILGTR